MLINSNRVAAQVDTQVHSVVQQRPAVIASRRAQSTLPLGQQQSIATHRSTMFGNPAAALFVERNTPEQAAQCVRTSRGVRIHFQVQLLRHLSEGRHDGSIARSETKHP
jgi:hypothetical protein